jgi:hypothetical protein
MSCHRSLCGRLRRYLDALFVASDDSSVGLGPYGFALADDDEQQPYSLCRTLTGGGRLPVDTVQSRLSAALSLSNSVPRIPLETRRDRRLSDGYRTRLLLSRLLLGTYGAALLRRSDEPVVDWWSDAIRFTRKSLAFRRVGGTDHWRYRRGLWPASSKHFVTEASAKSVRHCSS